MNKVYVVVVDLRYGRNCGYIDSIYLMEKSAQERIIELQDGNELDGVYFELRIEEHIVK